MKVLPVSLSFRSKQYENNYDSAYMYSQKVHERRDLTSPYIVMTALAAVSAVTITLFNLGGKRILPENIVEVANKNKGLNRLKEQENLVEILKSKFLYPLKASVSGDKRIRYSEDFNTGVIITGTDKSKLSATVSALSEHVQELGFDVEYFQTTVSRKKKDGTVYSRSLKKNEIIKRLLNMVITAQEKYKKTGKYTVINLGDIDKLTKFKVAKTEKSSIDEIVEGLNDKQYKGIMWFGYTSKGKAVPLSFNELPVLITKLAE